MLLIKEPSLGTHVNSRTVYCFSNAQDPDDAHIIAIWADMVELLTLPVATCYGQVLYQVVLQSTSKSTSEPVPLFAHGATRAIGGTMSEMQRL